MAAADPFELPSGDAGYDEKFGKLGLTFDDVMLLPAESSVLLGGQAGPHKIEGVGIGYTPPLWAPELVNEILPVTTEDAKDMARRLAREEALFAGTSSGANVVAALQVAERLGPGAKVVTLMADSGLKYLSTDVYGSSPRTRVP